MQDAKSDANIVSSFITPSNEIIIAFILYFLISYLLGMLIDTSISYSSNSSNSLSVFSLLIISIGGLTSTLLPGTVLHSFLARSNDIPSTLVVANRLAR